MALFEHYTPIGRKLVAADAATRALSVAEVETDFVNRVYHNLAEVYDVTFGPVLHRGRITAIERMALGPGESVLEVGVGTGINLPIYPSSCRVTGVDLSAKMLARARRRIVSEGLRNCHVQEMNAEALAYRDDAFDVVYAPYVISVVSDPVKVAREMFRVCKPGGRVVVLNHVRSTHPVLSKIETAISPMTVHIGFKADLDLPGFLAQADLSPVSIEKVNVPRMWTLVTCVK
jgi:phosphatidylethanolamine/phosphatidyl-N-methylethanolamine N-methyltransferase